MTLSKGAPPCPRNARRAWTFGIVTLLVCVALLGVAKWATTTRAPGPQLPVAQSLPLTQAGDPLPPPRLPSLGGEHAPAFSSLRPGETFDPKAFGDQETCKGCHQEAVDQWSQSTHAWASLSNPIYLESLDSFLQERGAEKAKFCAGCHDPALLFDPAVTLSTSTALPQAHQGVGCLSCHGAVEAVREGNGSYTLSTAPVPLPVEGDQASLTAHLAHVRVKKEEQTTLCVSCHRGFLSPEMGHEVVIAGLDELGAWRRSAYNQNLTTRMDEPLPAQDCVSCHMPKAAGISSHRFAGGHTTLAAMIDSPDQLDAVAARLKGIASLTLVPRVIKDSLEVDVVVFNDLVGHHFPGGARDLRDTWVEVTLLDQAGQVIASSGMDHERTGREPHTYILHARLADKEGGTQRDHNVSHFRTPVYDHTIAPRDAHIARYAFVLPPGVKPALLKARLRHRRLTPDLHAKACARSKTPQGTQTLEHIKTYKHTTIDPCIPQPIVDIAQTSAPLDGSLVLSWRDHYVHGLGLLHHAHENLGEAKQALRAATRTLLALQAPKPLHQAMVLQALGDVSARQGRTDEAIDLYMQADALVPRHPSTWAKIGAATQQVWRFEEAAKAYTKALELQPDTRSAKALAIALGSIASHRQALEIAQKGLLTESRDSDLLRSQMLAYRALGAPVAWLESTAKAYDQYKFDEDAPHVRDLCSKHDEVCRAERMPIGVRWLRPHPKP